MIRYKGELYIAESSQRSKEEAKWRLVKPYLEKFHKDRHDLIKLVGKYRTYQEFQADKTLSEEDQDWIHDCYWNALEQLKQRSFLS